jgi:putative ATP-dependent endonuclease of OLD family
MFLCQVHIANFRGIKKLSLILDDTTVLIGENNICKSTILDLLYLST